MTHGSRKEIDALLRNDFPTFLHKCVQMLNPGTPFLMNSHIEAIDYKLSKVRDGELTRVIFNLPPRYLKSTIVSVAFAAFALGHNPRRRIICISYGTDLAAKHAADFRAIVELDWYRRAFPKMKIARATDLEIHTTARGFRKATSVGGSLTGLGGDCFILDDPQKPVDAQSDIRRNHLNQWFSNTLISRLDNKQTSAIIIVMQRVHQQDLVGYLTENSDNWTVLSLPAIAETDEEIAVGDDLFYRRKVGQPLHAAHESLDTLEKLRADVGPDVFAAQYQQSPVPAGGGLIRREWLRYYDRLPERCYWRVIQSWDTAAKGGAQNDFSVCTTWYIADKCYYLVDVTRGRYDYPLLRNTAIELAKRFKPQTILIEDASTGTALAQELNTAYRHGVVVPIPIEHDKVGRLYVQQAKFAGGLVLFPRNAHFLPVLEAELLTFPQSKYDDQVDSISQALAYNSIGYDFTYSGFQD